MTPAVRAMAVSVVRLAIDRPRDVALDGIARALAVLIHVGKRSGAFDGSYEDIVTALALDVQKAIDDLIAQHGDKPIPKSPLTLIPGGKS